MFKTTDELKGEMLEMLHVLAARTSTPTLLRAFDTMLQDYLARLDDEAQSSAARLEEQTKWAAICSDAYTFQQQLTHAACVTERETWSENHELKSRIKLLEQANEAAGYELREAHDLIRRQRESIGRLYMAKEERETAPGTSAQSSDEKAVGEVFGTIQRLCQHSWRTVHAYPSFKEQLECIFCLKIEEA